MTGGTSHLANTYWSRYQIIYTVTIYLESSIVLCPFLWYIHTAREQEWDREQNQWDPIYYAEMLTLVRDRDRN